MAETLISPGVLARENDQSQITSQPVQAGAAIVGPTVKGKVGIPKLVTTYSEYLANFGSTFESGSDTYSFLTSISAYNYFQNGGTSLLVTRVASGSFDPSTTSTIYNNVESGVLTTEAGLSDISTNSTASITGTTGSLSATTDGSGTSAVFSIIKTSGSIVTSITATAGGSGYVIGDTLTFASSSIDTDDDVVVTLAATDIVNQQAFVLETLAEGVTQNSAGAESSAGALTNGTTDNIRWEIVNPNTSSGVFSVVIRQGNDNTKSKSVLETFSNVSLDPKATNYIAKVIGDQTTTLQGTGTSEPYLQVTGSYPNASRYVRVSAVNAKTPDYLDNDGAAKTAFTASIPTAASGTFSGATGDITGTGDNFYQNINNTDSQGLAGTDYTDAFNLLANKDEYVYNVITAPGLVYENATHATPLNTLISNIEGRGDAIIVLDLQNYGSTVAGAPQTAANVDSSYAATYWPWLQITDPDSGQLAWVPASTLIPGVYANNDRTSEAWFAPAGINRGGLGIVRQAERKLTQSNRDTLYTGKVNPIATFPGRGVVVFGQKTLQTKASALDRVNVRRLLIELKSYISQVADNLVFEQNTAATRNQFLSQVNPYLESVQQRQGLYAFKVVMDDTNNTADVIDRNELVGAIYLQPTKTAEFIYLDFNLLPTGATFPS
jgi:phage tail sheath protein FI